MKKIAESLTDLVGNTPLLELSNYNKNKGLKARVIAKLEYFNPAVMKTGTSMAAPVVSGAVACLLSKYPDMTNVEVKLKLREACVKIKGTEAGWGMLHVGRLMK